MNLHKHGPKSRPKLDLADLTREYEQVEHIAQALYPRLQTRNLNPFVDQLPPNTPHLLGITTAGVTTIPRNADTRRWQCTNPDCWICFPAPR